MSAVEDYLVAKGVELKRAGGTEVHMACFLCGEDPQKRGRLYVNVEENAAIPGLFFCHRCGAKGSLVSIKKHFGDYDSTSKEEETGQYRRDILQAAATFYHENLTDEVFAWLRQERGLEIDTIISQQLGWAGGGLYGHLRSLGFQTKDILETGLVVEDRQSSRLVDFLQGMVTIPYLVAGNVVMIRGRAWDPAASAKYKTPPKQSSRLFGTDAVWGVDILVIAEGEFDALVLRQLGFPTVGVPGANIWQDSWDGYLADIRRVYVVFDSDKSGRDGAAKLQARFGPKIRVVELPAPEGATADITDWLVKEGHTPAEFQALLDKANASGLLVSVDQAAEEFHEYQGVDGIKFGIEALDHLISPGLLPWQVMVVLAKSGTGKGHPVDTEVPTPDGFRRWGDLEVGDEVFGRDGRPTAITGVFDRGTLSTYRVSFSDGSDVLVDADHLWTVYARSGRKREWQEVQLTTRHLLASNLRAGHGEGEYRYCIPMARPAEFAKADLPIEPYTCGALIANGTLGGSSAILSTPDKDVSDRVGLSYLVRRIASPPGACPRFVVRGVIGAIRRLGLNVHSRDKFIPEAYLTASVGQRIDLLHGLMDGDGSSRASIGRRAARYSTTSRKLAKGIIQLVNSLGGTAQERWYTNRGDECSVSIRLPNDISPFWSDRKGGVPWVVNHSEPRRAVRAVDYVGEYPIRCITVANDDHLYQIGRQHIVTHNTIWLLNAFQRIAMLNPAVKILFVSLEQTKSEWYDRARRMHRFYNLNDTDLDCLAFWRNRFMLVDKNRLSPDEFSALLDDYEFQMGSPPDLVGVDYLGYYAQSFKGDRYERVSDAVMSLKEIAKDRRMPIITPHQVSRIAKYGEEPDTDAARDAGVIEETADFLFTLWTQDHILGKDEDEKSGVVNMRIGKSRHGGRGAKISFQFAPLSLVMVPHGNGSQADRTALERARHELNYERLREDWETAHCRHRGLLPQGARAAAGDWRR